MADYRQIHVRIWDDPWFVDLTPEARLTFIWLISNDKASVSGIYEFSIGRCARETGLSRNQVSDSIDAFIASDKVMIEGDYIWVKKLRKYNDSGSPNAYKRIMTDLEMLPDGLMKESYTSYYPRADKTETDCKPIDNDLETHTQPLDNPLEAHTKNKEQGTRNKEQGTLNIEQPFKDSAQKPRRVSKPVDVDVRKDHPAILAIKTVCKRYPPKEAWDLIIGRLGENPDLSKLTNINTRWVASGKNPMNYDGITDWYVNGMPDYHARTSTTTSRVLQNHEINKSVFALTPEEQAELARSNGNFS